MQSRKQELLLAIQRKREVMIEEALRTGYTSEETVRYSQELDELIFQYQLHLRLQKTKMNIVKKSFKSMIVWPKHLVYKPQVISEIL
ncbi:aspartyl-phosphate phosphatase Spo0E family protein [Niallia taxi]|uniref:aspartyl-phosphate phosphatase Spo0E family protein n=1 Tax=Niallia taxi TaxID=2499688 RepID=UPI0021A604B0|nr:aspartyl-phosphate phosphatase Spo0E family protein [Niallia taxi]MCT2344107.1 aspartyl-phosphate phosphatase Spo0E family protein [Niallia taxi]MDE5051314.1 aspartyl-phosphate phosphatase Spo0E family protein [Niallia taxi]WOD62248.1 aspartyl-phosphate phosphatase Spo0E family protein [Niallia taxi]